MSTNLLPRELFELHPITGDPRFDGFGIAIDTPSSIGRASLMDDLSCPGANSDPNWRPVSLSKTWVAPQSRGNVRRYNDYPCANLIFPVFSERACNALRDLLEPNGELLPVKANNGGSYFLYHVMNFVDALDKKKSTCDWFTNPNGPPLSAVDIDYFVFNEKQLAGLSIFQLRAWAGHKIVTNVFVDRVEQAGLNGFDFAKIWPFPRGVRWQTEDAERRRHKRRQSDLEKQMLVVILYLAGDSPNAKEKKLIKRVEDELDALLNVSSLNSTYFGSYAGTDVTNGEYRMFLTCPNADKLYNKVHDWLQKLNWPGYARAIKRYGKMFDQKAREKVIHIPDDL